ncbi:nicotinate phosphoribosyltransferase [Parasutterella excrementihominis]|uniref:nicotinate phosphoribosyltransferase n=1 Tax=Parasutterella excrementihominis TaxID=487175 RepID=UPI00248C06A1|nr:nicotinate phosphoribosyltransferase [Parasutterella excrementihominis]
MIIDSLLDTDLYKFTMMQCVLHQFPAAQAEYKFKCRNPGTDLQAVIGPINEEIDHLCALHFRKNELDYLRSLRFMKSDFIDFLELFHLKRSSIVVKKAEGSDTDIEIRIRGPWLHTIMFEIPVLAIVNECYYRKFYPNQDLAEGRRRLKAKIESIKDIQDIGISEYGTRRRFSKAWQEEVIKTMQVTMGKQFTGTSNVYYAMQLGLTPLGTMAHEYLQACQALGPRLRDSQKYAFEMWAKEYRGDLGIALSDVYGMKPFLLDFDMYFCKLFDGARHDSGDPFEWGEHLIEHYRKNRCDPKTKTLIFSDMLDFPKVISLYNAFHGRIRLGFGIGTNLVNDLGIPSLQNVIKLIRCNDQPVAKLSDDPVKSMCEDESYLRYLKTVFNI